MSEPTRIRLRFTKVGKIRFIGHRDVAKLWERALRKGTISMAYSEGFSPRPKVHFGLALPTSAQSLAEYIDVDVASHVDVVELPSRLSPHLPVGMDVTAARVISRSAEALQAAVTSCSWKIRLHGVELSKIGHSVTTIMDSHSCVLTIDRKGKSLDYDIRPSITALTVTSGHDGVVELNTELATKPRGIRPLELLRALDVPDVYYDVERLAQWITIDGQRSEPIPLAPSHDHLVEVV